ncbi:MAG: hypothetical protein ACK4M4_06485, partial [Flavobacterium sp.]
MKILRIVQNVTFDSSSLTMVFLNLLFLPRIQDKTIMNSIAEQIADFLKEYAPFNFLNYEELLQIASSIRVINLEKNKTLFQINDALHDSFYVVATGGIKLSVIA